MSLMMKSTKIPINCKNICKNEIHLFDNFLWSIRCKVSSTMAGMRMD